MAPAPMDGVPDAHGRRAAACRSRTRSTNGVWVFTLEPEPVRWEILPGDARHRLDVQRRRARPRDPRPVRAARADRRRRTTCPTTTTVHWHGIDVPNAMDGVPGVTQEPIEPGRELHVRVRRSTRQDATLRAARSSTTPTSTRTASSALGLSGAFVIEPKQPQRYDVEKTVADPGVEPRRGDRRDPARDGDGGHAAQLLHAEREELPGDRDRDGQAWAASALPARRRRLPLAPDASARHRLHGRREGRPSAGGRRSRRT